MGFARRSVAASRRSNRIKHRLAPRRTGMYGEQLEDRLVLAASCGLEPEIAVVQTDVTELTSISAATDLSASSQHLEFNGWVGWLDRSDLFRFEVEQDSNITIELSDLSANLNLTVYDSVSDLMGASANSFARDEALSGQLPSGTYYAMVHPDRRSDMSSYRLTIALSAIAVVPAPNPVAAPAPTSPAPAPTPAASNPVKDTPADSPPVAPAEPITPDIFPNVAYFGGQTDWSLNAINAPEAWTQGYTGAGVIVAVVDTGIDLDHRDLDANLWTNHSEIFGNGIDDDRNGYIDDVHGWDFATGDATPNDINGHGTHVAGIIAGELNSTGSTGVAYDATIMPVQVLGSDGSGSMFDVAAGIRYAVDNGADIINLSLGSGSGSYTIQSALMYAEQHDVLVVAAAGNSGGATPDYPARYGSSLSNVLSVGAYSSQDVIADFSNSVGGSGVTQVDAPGVGIYSAYANNRSTTLSGTSMAAPQVAGLAALTLAANPDLTSAELRDLIVAGADGSIRNSDSRGGINAAATVAQAAKYAGSSSATATVATATSRARTDAVFARSIAQANQSAIAAWLDAADDGKQKRARVADASSVTVTQIDTGQQAQAVDLLMAANGDVQGA